MMTDNDAYEDEEFYEAPYWTVRTAAVGAFVLVAAAVLWFGVLPFGRSAESALVSTAQAGSGPSVTDASAEQTTQDSAAPNEVESESIETSTTAVAQPQPTPVTAAPAPVPVPVSVSSTAPANYETLPDGSPVPVLAIFDGDLITLSGAVPSEAAIERLRVLAVANSTEPGAEVASFLTVDPTVPVGVGVRVIEMNSPRFPEGSPEISIEHAAQLDRVVAIMTALPNITVEVIGHADQRGDDTTNFELSTDRARAAADHLSSQGIDPSRLSSRGAGESDLLTLNNDEAALALNRRTEFVFSGLLVDVSEPT